MYSKKYMYDSGQKICIKMIEDGYIHTYEEIFKLLNLNEKVKKDAERGLFKTMPRVLRDAPDVLSHIADSLKATEEATRKGNYEENYQIRMKLGKHFHEQEGYQWLAEYFYKSSHTQDYSATIDEKLKITSLQQQALLEESKGNTDIARKHFEKAWKLAQKNSMDVEDRVQKQLNEDLCRVYQVLGIEYLAKESEQIGAQKSMSVKYFEKAANLAMAGDDFKQKATSQALLGKAMMKYNEDELALKCFELFIELSRKCYDKYGECQGFFAKSEIYKRNRDFDSSVLALNECWKIAKEQQFDSPLIFSAISLGQIETAKRQYSKANKYFEDVYEAINKSNEDFPNKKTLRKLTRVMSGIGKAHLSFHHLITTMQSLQSQHLPKIIHWRNTGGLFEGKIIEKPDHEIDLDQTEIRDKEAEISAFIDKLIDNELKE